MTHNVRLPIAMGLLVGLACNGALAQNFSDNFDDRDASASTIGGGWKVFNEEYSDAGCTNYTNGANYGDAPNRNYTTTNSGGDTNYYNSGLEVGNDNAISGTSLRVYENFYTPGTVACARTTVFKEYTESSIAQGGYRFTAEVREQKYATNAANTSQGMFWQLLDVGNSYNTIAGAYSPVSPGASSSVVSINFTVPDISAYTGGVVLKVGMYSQGAGNNTSGAVWDNTTLGPVAYTVLQRDPNAVPVLPIGSLLGLMGLVGWMGWRRKAL